MSVFNSSDSTSTGTIPLFWEPFHKSGIVLVGVVPELSFYSKLVQKSILSTNVQKTILKYKCTENQFTVQVYRKPIYSTSVQKTSLY